MNQQPKTLNQGLLVSDSRATLYFPVNALTMSLLSSGLGGTTPLTNLTAVVEVKRLEAESSDANLCNGPWLMSCTSSHKVRTLTVVHYIQMHHIEEPAGLSPSKHLRGRQPRKSQTGEAQKILSRKRQSERKKMLDVMSGHGLKKEDCFCEELSYTIVYYCLYVLKPKPW